jgi:hypothetical protein
MATPKLGGKANKKKLTDNEKKIQAALLVYLEGDTEWRDKLPKNKKGEICSLTSENPDGRELMVYVKHHCVDDMTPSAVVKKYVQYKQYSLSAIASALNHHRKTLRDDVANRASDLLSPRKLFILSSCCLNQLTNMPLLPLLLQVTQVVVECILFPKQTRTQMMTKNTT